MSENTNQRIHKQYSSVCIFSKNNRLIGLYAYPDIYIRGSKSDAWSQKVRKVQWVTTSNGYGKERRILISP